MGHGSYKASDWAKLKNSRGISASSSVDQIFSGNSLSEKYDPKFINMRESCDSEDSPNSTPVILAFDVTGSMGYLAAEIAKNSLNKTAIELYDKQPVSNPHIMCAAITSPDNYGGGFLQVTQFEADIRVVEQLLELKVGFGGNRYSFDSLIWYFAAKHTSIDSYKKRGKKGFLFVIGDEICGAQHGESLSVKEVKDVFNDDITHNLPLKNVYKMASEMYEIYHIVADRASSMESWEAFLPGRVAYIAAKDIQYLSEVITTIMQMANGMEKRTAISQWPKEVQSVVENAVTHITIKKTKKTVAKLESQDNEKKSKSFLGKLFS